ncbi:hypothetical protein GLOIN_2v1768861 [Rhizophagus irregularis DAOM 181602=DAOM 197198]|nr:hypothetical protein GLOIN_2v1768861 [Rhizophagus irregularis DAOM 181602=DAOM 197198]
MKKLVDEVVILRVEEAIFHDADADDCDAGIEVAIFGGVGVDEVAIFGGVAVEEAIFCGVSVDKVVIFRDADVDDRDASVEEAIFRDADADDRDAGVEVAIFGGVGVDEVAIFGGVAVEEAIFCGVDIDEVVIFHDADADDRDAGVEVAIFGGVGVDEVAIFCGAGVDDSAIFGGGVFGRRKRIAANILDEYNNPKPQDTTISIDIYSDNDTYEQQQYVFLPRKKRSKTGTLHHITEVEQVAESTEYDTDDIYTSESSAQEDSPNNDDNEFSSNFENYSHPMFDIPDISDTPNISELPTDELIKGILIWIMKFRSSHNIPNTAIEELIQFIKIILKVSCQKCHKLYKKEDIISNDDNTIMKCSHVEFPNSATKRLKQCQTPLGKKISLNNSISIVPELIHPVSSIQQQLSSMFKRPGFEELLRHWTRRSVIDNVLSDIYDGQIWQNLKESNEQGSNNFF